MTKTKIPGTFEHKNDATVTVPISIEKYEAFLCVDKIVFISFETNKSLKICFSKFGNYSLREKEGKNLAKSFIFQSIEQIIIMMIISLPLSDLSGVDPIKTTKAKFVTVLVPV